MKNYDETAEINHNLNWRYVLDHPYRILIIGGSGSGKTNVLLNLIKHQQPDIDKIYLHVQDLLYQSINYLLTEGEKQELKHYKIQDHSLIMHKQFMIFMKIWKTLTQLRKREW